MIDLRISLGDILAIVGGLFALARISGRIGALQVKVDTLWEKFMHNDRSDK